MNKNYTSIIVLIMVLFFGALSAQETQKNFINYQGVARNASNELMVGENMTIGIALKFGAANAETVYEENHSITTDTNGVFSLLIGNGSSTSGTYNALPWGSGATFVTVSMNGSEIGTTEMMAVPYAISAGSMKDPLAEEVRYDNSVSGLTATTAQDAIDELVTSGSVDADADPTNELQTISFDAVSNKISLTDGGEITIPSGGTDADADPTNEIQTISFDVGTNELSLSDGGSVTLPSGGTDADADPTNELQDISLSGTELTITDGSTIDFAPILPPGGTDNQELTFNETTKILEIEDGNTVDLSSLSGGGTGGSLWNEEATHIYSDNRVGINTGGEIPKTLFEIAGVPGVSEDVGFTNALFTITDNEIAGGPFRMVMGGKAIQTLANGIPSKMMLNGEGGAVGIGVFPTATLDVDGDARVRNLSGLGERNVMADADGNLVIGSGGSGSSLWTEDEDGISRRSGVVGIGHQASLNAKLYVQNSNEDIRNGISASVFNPGYKVGISSSARSNDDENTFGMRTTVTSDAGATSWGYRSDMIGAGTGTKYGFYSRLTGGTGIKYGLFVDGDDRNYFSGDLGIGTETPTSKLDVDGSIRSRNLSGTGQRNVMADADGNLVIGSGGGGSLWGQNGSDVYYGGGNVGVGTTAPETTLHINSPNDEASRLQTSGTNNYISFFNTNGYRGYAGIWTGDNDMDFGTGAGNVAGKVHLTTGASPKLTVIASGNVGIGTQTPTAKLDVTGNIKTSGEINRTSTGDANMVPIAYGNISPGGTTNSGSGNFTTRKVNEGYYRISIVGEAYSIYDYSTQLTVNFGSSVRHISSGGLDGELSVTTYDKDGNRSDTPFSFVVYKQ